MLPLALPVELLMEAFPLSQAPQMCGTLLQQPQEGDPLGMELIDDEAG